MANEEAVKVLEDMKVKISIPKAAELQRKRNEAIDMAISALKAQSGKDINVRSTEVAQDTISRQDVITSFRLDDDGTAWSMEDIIYRIEQFPSAEPARPTGRWERHYSRPNVYADLWWHCSVCGYKNDDQYANHYHHFCPNCGSPMEVGHER